MAIAWSNSDRRHHIVQYYTHRMMERNFNLTYPLADWLFGTSDLNRDALSHPITGHSNQHVKPNPRRIVATSDNPNAERLAEELGGDVQLEDLIALPRYTAVVRLLINGQPSRPFNIRTLPPPAVTSRHAAVDKLIHTSNQRYASSAA